MVEMKADTPVVHGHGDIRASVDQRMRDHFAKHSSSGLKEQREIVFNVLSIVIKDVLKTPSN